MSDIDPKKTFEEIFSYEAASPGILRVRHEIDYRTTLTEEYNFQTRQLLSLCKAAHSGGSVGVAMFRQNFRDIERHEVIEEMRAKLIDLGGDPDRYTTSVDGRNKRALVPPKV